MSTDHDILFNWLFVAAWKSSKDTQAFTNRVEIPMKFLSKEEPGLEKEISEILTNEFPRDSGIIHTTDFRDLLYGRTLVVTLVLNHEKSGRALVAFLVKGYLKLRSSWITLLLNLCDTASDFITPEEFLGNKITNIVTKFDDKQLFAHGFHGFEPEMASKPYRQKVKPIEEFYSAMLDPVLPLIANEEVTFGVERTGSISKKIGELIPPAVSKPKPEMKPSECLFKINTSFPLFSIPQIDGDESWMYQSDKVEDYFEKFKEGLERILSHFKPSFQLSVLRNIASRLPEYEQNGRYTDMIDMLFHLFPDVSIFQMPISKALGTILLGESEESLVEYFKNYISINFSVSSILTASDNTRYRRAVYRAFGNMQVFRDTLTLDMLEVAPLSVTFSDGTFDLREALGQQALQTLKVFDKTTEFLSGHAVNEKVVLMNFLMESFKSIHVASSDRKDEWFLCEPMWKEINDEIHATLLKRMSQCRDKWIGLYSDEAFDKDTLQLESMLPNLVGFATSITSEMTTWFPPNKRNAPTFALAPMEGETWETGLGRTAVRVSGKSVFPKEFPLNFPEVLPELQWFLYTQRDSLRADPAFIGLMLAEKKMPRLTGFIKTIVSMHSQEYLTLAMYAKMMANCRNSVDYQWLYIMVLNALSCLHEIATYYVKPGHFSPDKITPLSKDFFESPWVPVLTWMKEAQAKVAVEMQVKPQGETKDFFDQLSQLPSKSIGMTTRTWAENTPEVRKFFKGRIGVGHEYTMRALHFLCVAQHLRTHVSSCFTKELGHAGKLEGSLLDGASAELSLVWQTNLQSELTKCIHQLSFNQSQYKSRLTSGATKLLLKRSKLDGPPDETAEMLLGTQAVMGTMNKAAMACIKLLLDFMAPESAYQESDFSKDSRLWKVFVRVTGNTSDRDSMRWMLKKIRVELENEDLPEEKKTAYKEVLKIGSAWVGKGLPTDLQNFLDEAKDDLLWDYFGFLKDLAGQPFFQHAPLATEPSLNQDVTQIGQIYTMQSAFSNLFQPFSKEEGSGDFSLPGWAWRALNVIGDYATPSILTALFGSQLIVNSGLGREGGIMINNAIQSSYDTLSGLPGGNEIIELAKLASGDFSKTFANMQDFVDQLSDETKKVLDVFSRDKRNDQVLKPQEFYAVWNSIDEDIRGFIASEGATHYDTLNFEEEENRTALRFLIKGTDINETISLTRDAYGRNWEELWSKIFDVIETDWKYAMGKVNERSPYVQNEQLKREIEDFLENEEPPKNPQELEKYEKVQRFYKRFYTSAYPIAMFLTDTKESQVAREWMQEPSSVQFFQFVTPSQLLGKKPIYDDMNPQRSVPFTMALPMVILYAAFKSIGMLKYARTSSLRFGKKANLLQTFSTDSVLRKNLQSNLRTIHFNESQFRGIDRKQPLEAFQLLFGNDDTSYIYKCLSHICEVKYKQTGDQKIENLYARVAGLVFDIRSSELKSYSLVTPEILYAAFYSGDGLNYKFEEGINDPNKINRWVKKQSIMGIAEALDICHDILWFLSVLRESEEGGASFARKKNNQGVFPEANDWIDLVYKAAAYASILGPTLAYATGYSGSLILPLGQSFFALAAAEEARFDQVVGYILASFSSIFMPRVRLLRKIISIRGGNFLERSGALKLFRYLPESADYLTWIQETYATYDTMPLASGSLLSFLMTRRTTLTFIGSSTLQQVNALVRTASRLLPSQWPSWLSSDQVIQVIKAGVTGGSPYFERVAEWLVTLLSGITTLGEQSDSTHQTAKYAQIAIDALARDVIHGSRTGALTLYYSPRRPEDPMTKPRRPVTFEGFADPDVDPENLRSINYLSGMQTDQEIPSGPAETSESFLTTENITVWIKLSAIPWFTQTALPWAWRHPFYTIGGAFAGIYALKYGYRVAKWSLSIPESLYSLTVRFLDWRKKRLLNAKEKTKEFDSVFWNLNTETTTTPKNKEVAKTFVKKITDIRNKLLKIPMRSDWYIPSSYRKSQAIAITELKRAINEFNKIIAENEANWGEVFDRKRKILRSKLFGSSAPTKRISNVPSDVVAYEQPLASRKIVRPTRRTGTAMTIAKKNPLEEYLWKVNGIVSDIQTKIKGLLAKKTLGGVTTNNSVARILKTVEDVQLTLENISMEDISDSDKTFIEDVLLDQLADFIASIKRYLREFNGADHKANLQTLFADIGSLNESLKDYFQISSGTRVQQFVYPSEMQPDTESESGTISTDLAVVGSIERSLVQSNRDIEEKQAELQHLKDQGIQEEAEVKQESVENRLASELHQEIQRTYNVLTHFHRLMNQPITSMVEEQKVLGSLERLNQLIQSREILASTVRAGERTLKNLEEQLGELRKRLENITLSPETLGKIQTEINRISQARDEAEVIFHRKMSELSATDERINELSTQSRLQSPQKRDTLPNRPSPPSNPEKQDALGTDIPNYWGPPMPPVSQTGPTKESEEEEPLKKASKTSDAVLSAMEANIMRPPEPGKPKKRKLSETKEKKSHISGVLPYFSETGIIEFYAQMESGAKLNEDDTYEMSPEETEQVFNQVLSWCNSETSHLESFYPAFDLAFLFTITPESITAAINENQTVRPDKASPDIPSFCEALQTLAFEGAKYIYLEEDQTLQQVLQESSSVSKEDPAVVGHQLAVLWEIYGQYPSDSVGDFYATLRKTLVTMPCTDIRETSLAFLGDQPNGTLLTLASIYLNLTYLVILSNNVYGTRNGMKYLLQCDLDFMTKHVERKTGEIIERNLTGSPGPTTKKTRVTQENPWSALMEPVLTDAPRQTILFNQDKQAMASVTHVGDSHVFVDYQKDTRLSIRNEGVGSACLSQLKTAPDFSPKAGGNPATELVTLCRPIRPEEQRPPVDPLTASRLEILKGDTSGLTMGDLKSIDQEAAKVQTEESTKTRQAYEILGGLQQPQEEPLSESQSLDIESQATDEGAQALLNVQEKATEQASLPIESSLIDDALELSEEEGGWGELEIGELQSTSKNE